MPQRQKKTNQSHRVVCLCTSYECSDQVYADAEGLYHPGVEVLPETHQTHERADFRNNLLKSPRTPDHHVQPLTSAVQDALLSPLRQLHLATSPSPIRSHQSDQDPFVQPELPADIEDNQSVDNDHSPPADPDSPIEFTTQRTSRKSQTAPTKTCSTSILAKESGQRVFDCGEFILGLFKIIIPIFNICVIQC